MRTAGTVCDNSPGEFGDTSIIVIGVQEVEGETAEASEDLGF